MMLAPPHGDEWGEVQNFGAVHARPKVTLCDCGASRSCQKCTRQKCTRQNCICIFCCHVQFTPKATARNGAARHCIGPTEAHLAWRPKIPKTRPPTSEAASPISKPRSRRSACPRVVSRRVASCRVLAHHFIFISSSFHLISHQCPNAQRLGHLVATRPTLDLPVPHHITLGDTDVDVYHTVQHIEYAVCSNPCRFPPRALCVASLPKDTVEYISSPFEDKL